MTAGNLLMKRKLAFVTKLGTLPYKKSPKVFPTLLFIGTTVPGQQVVPLGGTTYLLDSTIPILGNTRLFMNF
jgi:hypothetical protein